MSTNLYNTCSNCRLCNSDGYCVIKEEKVKPNSTCSDFEEK